MKKAAIIFVILFILTLAVPAAVSAAKSKTGTSELITIFSAQAGKTQSFCNTF